MNPASPARRCRNPVQCIVPPYMVEQMARCPDDRIRERALAALAHGAGQGLRAATTGDDAQAHLGQGKAGVVGGVNEVAHQ